VAEELDVEEEAEAVAGREAVATVIKKDQILALWQDNLCRSKLLQRDC
jgi:hypothetical protein